ncbi:MAG: GatB/YqeY domain-containing protein [Pseudomonadota bacterium]
MSLRERLSAAMKDAMRAREADRLSAIRLITAAIKDKDIAIRGEGGEVPASDADLMAVLARMVKQRQDSAKIYEEGGRADLAARELAEVRVIEEFLPKPLSAAETAAAIRAAIAATGATSIRDMGRVMAALRAEHAGRMDFGAAGPLVRAALG